MCFENWLCWVFSKIHPPNNICDECIFLTLDKQYLYRLPGIYLININLLFAEYIYKTLGKHKFCWVYFFAKCFFIALDKEIVCRMPDRMHSATLGHSTNISFPVVPGRCCPSQLAQREGLYCGAIPGFVPRWPVGRHDHNQL